MAGVFSKVTVVTPRSRLDVALPADVPLIDMLPTLLDAAGGATEDPGRRDGWALSRLGSGELDSSYTPAQLSVRDGELLYLRPRGDAAPMTVFDDIIDALATGNRDRRGKWTRTTTRVAAMATGISVLLMGAVSLPFTGPPYLGVGLTGLALAATLLVLAVVFARALGEGRLGTAFALIATAYAGIGGLLLLGGDTPWRQLTIAHVTVGATAAVVAAALASVGVPAAAPVFLGAGACAAATFATIGLSAAMGRGLASAAAVTVVVAYAFLPSMPTLAYRLAGLARPAIPTERESLRQETETVDSARVADLGRRVDTYLSAMLGALAIISAGTAVIAAVSGGRALALAAALALLPILRSRAFGGRTHRLPLVLAGGVAAGAVAVAAFVMLDPQVRLLGVLGVSVIVAATTVGIGLVGQGPQSSPPWNRFLDIIEVLVILALVPLAAWVGGALEWARAIRG